MLKTKWESSPQFLKDDAQVRVLYLHVQICDIPFRDMLDLLNTQLMC